MKKRIILWIILLIPYLCAYLIWNLHKREIAKIDSATFVVVSKADMQLTVYDYKGNMLGRYPIAIGLNPGDKQEKGDMKTPEGIFHIGDIQKSANWKHDFGDGKGEIEGAYGPFFIRLNTPGHKGIGIHGTHNPASLGSRVTEGCIRMNNKDVTELVNRVKVGNIVVITPAKDDLNNNNIETSSVQGRK
jgi:lipoprotein-anchoring transpeptidase ErfK/SrfK